MCVSCKQMFIHGLDAFSVEKKNHEMRGVFKLITGSVNTK